MLLRFEHVKDSHIDLKLVEVINAILKKHDIENRVLVIIIDNAKNNKIFFVDFVNFLTNQMKNVFNNLQFSESDDSKHDMKHVSCLTHVLQLTIKALLSKIKMNFSNEELQKK